MAPLAEVVAVGADYRAGRARQHQRGGEQLGVTQVAGFIGRRRVGGLMVRVAALKLNWNTVQPLPDDELERRIYGEKAASGAQRPLLGCETPRRAARPLHARVQLSGDPAGCKRRAVAC